MLPDALLTEYASKFFGFGTWDAKIWFIGIEEAGGSREQDILARLAAWKQNRKPDLADAPAFYPASGQNDWHGDNAKPQATWKQLIRILLVARGRRDTDDGILEYQRFQFGSVAGRECLAELLPLPSPGSSAWNYRQWSNVPWLQSRCLYQNHLVLQRALGLQQKLEAHHPKVVIFYSSTWHRIWATISRGVWSQAIKGKLMGWDCGGTSFYVTRHPRAESDEYFRQIGEFLNKKHGKRH